MKLDVVLADTGTQDPLGKLNLLGAGWSQTVIGPNGLTPDTAVAVFIEANWDECNRETEVVLELLNADLEPVVVPLASGPEPLRVVQRVTIPTPQGAPNGSPGSFTLLARFQGGLPLQPGSWYQWRATVEGRHEDNWKARFYVQRRPSVPTIGSGGHG